MATHCNFHASRDDCRGRERASHRQINGRGGMLTFLLQLGGTEGEVTPRFYCPRYPLSGMRSRDCNSRTIIAMSNVSALQCLSLMFPTQSLPRPRVLLRLIPAVSYVVIYSDPMSRILSCVVANLKHVVKVSTKLAKQNLVGQ